MSNDIETVKLEGACVCGKVAIKAAKAATKVGACHCESCRKRGGGPWLLVDCGTDVTIEGLENVSLYDSSDWAERGFCKLCGSNLFYRFKKQHQYIVSSALFDYEFEFARQVFIEEKPKYYDFSNKTINMTGKELFAMLA